MVLGVRILSNNLSGQTASVTFLPISGGTIDLGNQIIPFNYYDSNPYGTYQLYISEYDYTYEVIVNEPPTDNNQTFISLSLTTGTTNYCLGTLNFSDITAEVINLDIDSNEWGVNYTSVINESGYIIGFTLNSNNEQKLYLYTDKNSNILGSYSAITNNYNYGDMNFMGFFFQDITNGVISHTNGETITEFTFNPNEQAAYILNDYDYTTKNKNILINVDTYSSNTRSIYCINSLETTLIDEFDYTFEDKNYVTFYNSEFIFNFNYNNVLSCYTDINILSEDGSTILNNFTLTPEKYRNYTYTPFGKNKIIICFWDNSDVDTPYLLYYYNGETNTSTTLEKPRGLEFANLQVFGSYYYNNMSSDCGIGGLIFWDSYPNESSQSSGLTVSYLDIVYNIDGSDNLNTYIYQDSGIPDKSFSVYQTISLKTLFGYGNTGDGNYSIITIGEGGVDYIPLQPYPFINENINRYNFADRVVTQIWSDYSWTGGTYYLTENGALLDSFNYDNTDGYWNYDYTYGIFKLSNNVTTKYINQTKNEFTSIGVYDDTYSSWYWWTDSGHADGRMILLNSQNGSTCLITENDFITGTTLPINGGNYTIRVGRDKFLYIYNQPNWEGKINVELYDFNFNLLNSVQTEFNEWESSFAYKDRYLAQFMDYTNDYLTTYLINENEIKKINTFNYNNNFDQRLINDKFWD